MDPVRGTSFGSRLRQYREAAALSQGELAARAGLSLRGVSDLERGVRNKPRWETVRMLAEGLSLNESEFASLLSARSSIRHVPGVGAGRASGELPVYLTSFVGRETECSDICKALQSPQVRLLTLKGPGGVGKTRVAIEAARKLIPRYEGGIAFVDLAIVRDSEQVLPTIADCLGITSKSGRELHEALEFALQGKRTLLILDNFEQVRDASIHVVNLLSMCPQLEVMVTSRALLRVAAEVVITIQPMPLPDSAELESLRCSDPVTMFVSRVAAMDSAFALTDENAFDIAEIVTRLQGVPLSIELAAARVRMLSTRRLRELLESQLLVLSGGARDAPARHRNIRETISWSYDLLPSAAQQVAKVMSIFPAGCTLETVTELLATRSEYQSSEILQAVETLVDSSMIGIYEGQDGQVRYQMLNVIREYGLEQLVAADALDATRLLAHEQWCLPLMVETDFMITRPDVAWCLNQIGAEYENLREHLSWLIEQGHVSEALEVSGYLSYFRGIRGYFDEGRRELEVLVSHPKNQAHSVDRTRAVIGLGKLCNYLSDPVSGYRWLLEGAELAEELSHLRYRELALNAAGTSMYMLAKIDDAEKLFVQALQIATEADHRFQIAVGKHCLSLIAESRGDSDLAEKLMLESYQVCIGEDFVWSVASGKVIVSAIHLRNGELDEAETLIHEAQELYLELQDWRDMPGSYLKLAEIARLKGNLVGARQYILHAIEIGQHIGSPMDVALGRLSMARVSRLANEHGTAFRRAVEALEWFVRCGNVPESHDCLLEITQIAVQCDQFERAAYTLGAVASLNQPEESSQTSSEVSSLADHVRAALSEDTWSVQFSRGSGSSASMALAELRTWTAFDS